MKLKLLASLLALNLIALTSCVRYVESREALAKRYDVDPAANRIGIDGFYRYELEQRKRLELLIEDREVQARIDTISSYRIGPGDQVKIRVKNFDEVSKNYTVASDGYIRLPFVGLVEIQGLSEAEAADTLSQLLTQYVNAPLVDVELTKYTSNVVWVLDNSARGRSLTETANQNAYGK